MSGTVKATASLTVTSATVASVSVTPAAQSIALGTTLAYSATGVFTDGTKMDLTSLVTWAASNGDAVLSNAAGSYGVATATAVGVTSVQAIYGPTAIVGSTPLTVTPAALVSIGVSPGTATVPSGLTQTFVATGTFTDGTTQDLPAVTWSSSSAAIMSISNAAGSYGVATAGTPGMAVMTATDPATGIAGTASVTVTSAILETVAVSPATAGMPLGTSLQLTATGTFSDQSTQDLTGTVTWSTSSASVAVANAPAIPAGFATSVSLGATIVTATDPTSGISGTATLTATPAALVSIAVSPPTTSVPSGLTQQFTAIGTYTDGSTQDVTQSATWSSSGPSATVSNAAGSVGLATGAAPGTASITATDPASKIQGATTMTTTAALLVSLSVSPSAPSIPAGLSVPLVATGLYTDGSSLDISSAVTWTATGNATVSNATGTSGQVTAGSVGSATVTATDPSTAIAASASVTVTAAVLVSMTLAPASVSLLTGQTRQLTATGTLSDGTIVPYTGAVTWGSSSAAVYAASNGLVTGVSVGDGTVTATDPATGVAATTTVAVTLNTSDSAALEISPYVNPVGDWAFGWEAAPGSGFQLSTTESSINGNTVWSATAPSGGSLEAIGNGTSSATTVDGAPLNPGQLAFTPTGLSGDSSQVDARWTAPAAGSYQVSVTFTGGARRSPVCNPVTTCTPYQYQCGEYYCGEYVCGSYQSCYSCNCGFFGCSTCCNTYYDYCYEYCPEYCTGQNCTTQTVCTTPVSTTNVAVLQNGSAIFGGYLNAQGPATRRPTRPPSR